MHQLAETRPDPQAAELAASMLAREDVQREILDETLASAEAGAITESGRTVCGSARSPIGPLARDYARVSLATCPLTVGGTWHTHVTMGELLNPVNSLPDLANVAFGVVDVSIVAGAESSHVVVATDDRAAMQDALADALGVDVGGPADVVAAVIDGDVRDPPAARQAVYDALGPEIAFRVDTAQPALADRVRDLEAEHLIAATVDLSSVAPYDAVVMSGCQMYARYAGHRNRSTGRMERVVRQGRGAQQCVRSVAHQATEADFSFRNQVLATTISVAVGNTVERLLFG